jgi:hypothetical protein
MSNVPPNPARPKRPAPLSIRLTDAERAALATMADGRPLGAFIKGVVLNAPSPYRSRTSPVKDGEAMGKVLALLGQSRIANNLNQLAKAANLGSLPVSAELMAELAAACAYVHEMRGLLLAALGVKTEPPAVVIDRRMRTRHSHHRGSHRGGGGASSAFATTFNASDVVRP